MQLEEHKAEFDKLGIAVVGMTYDSLEVLAGLHAEEELSYPLLQDVDAEHVNALGIRNEDYPEGHRAYGIPHPGVIFIDAEGIIRAKYAVAGYRERPPFDALIKHLAGLVNSSG